MTSALVLGASGMLGREVVIALTAAGLEVRGLPRGEFDLVAPGELPSADVVVNCAAYTDVERAEHEPERAFAANGHAVGHLSEIVRKQGGYLVHISTDFVFNGRKPTPYREDDVPDPLNVYGKSKLLGERLFQESGAAGCIARVQWSYGAGGNNFVEKIASLAQSRTQIKVVADQWGAPGWTRSLAAAVAQLAVQRPEGVIHLAQGGETTRHAVAAFIVKHLGLTTVVEPCSSADFPGVARPARSTFCTARAASLGIHLGTWEQALETYLRERST